MIDRVENASRYYSMNSLFRRAFEFIQTHDLATLPVGRYDIVEDDCYAMVQEPILKPLSEGRYEIHRDYFDIQVPIGGEETFGLVETPSDILDAAKWGEGGTLFFDAPIRPVTIKPGQFVILAPLKGAHAPCLTDGVPRKVKKLVIKVRAER